eukprot:GEMP01034338.1.p1 GENE.GEMP01034338.1~~GEMP01034338.1.p1  ORF type:complete len:201 (+),score=31.24 GEMP01034338.1:413-1015(+)
MLRNIGLLFILGLVFLTVVRRSRRGSWSLFRVFHLVDMPLEGELLEIDSTNADYYFQENPKDMLWFSFDPEQLSSVASANQSFRALSRATSMYPAYHFVWYNTKDHRDHAVEVLGCRQFPCISHTTPHGTTISVRHERRLNQASVHTFMRDLIAGKLPTFTPPPPSEWKRFRDRETSYFRKCRSLREFNEVDPEFEARRI